MLIDRQRVHEAEYRREVVETLVRAHAAVIMRYCTAWLGEGLAEEVTQEVFVTAWEKLPTYRPEASIDKWLLGIARHQCQRAHRNRQRRHAIDRAFLEDIRREAHAETPATPEHLLTQAPLETWLHDSLSTLHEPERMLLILHYWKGLAVPDIADVMSASARAIQKRLERARKRLREIMRHAAQE